MTRLSEQQLAEIRAQLGDAQPATDGLLESFASAIYQRAQHDHGREDWFCLNLAAYMGEKAAPVLRRLLDAESRAKRYRIAWRRARTRALAVGGAADRSGARARELQTALQDGVGALIGMQMERDAALAEVERLRARVAELEAAGHTDWRAWHDSDASMPLGQYTGRAAAMGHVHHVLAREEHVSAEAIGLRVRWVADDPHGPEDAETAWECWLLDADGDDEQPTGYVVSPIEVAAAYDPDGDE